MNEQQIQQTPVSKYPFLNQRMAEVDILKLLDKLEDIVDDSTCEVWGRAYGVKTEEFHMLINKIRASLPDEVRTASRLASDSDKIVSAAREEARIMVEHAREEAAKMIEEAREQVARLVDSSEISRLATAQAREIVASAEATAREIRRGADEYTREVLTNLESFTGKLISTIQRGREKLDQRIQYTNAEEEPALPSGRQRR
jgi:cell division septum initiation protein DivIVA